MRNGYKYYINESSKEWKVVPVDHDIQEFSSTMNYEKISDMTQNIFLDLFCSSKWVNDLHAIYEKFLLKDRLTVGIGSGYGEQELLLHLKGYRVIASDKVPDLSNQLSALFPGFKGMTIDIFKDDIVEKITTFEANNIEPFNMLVVGLDFYFNSNTTQSLFDKLSQNLSDDAFLIFTLRYPDSYVRRLIELMAYMEAKLYYTIKRHGIIQKHHGYRKTVNEIKGYAGNAGFEVISIEPTMFGCECSRSKIFGKVQSLCMYIDKIYPLFNCSYVFKMRKKGRENT